MTKNTTKKNVAVTLNDMDDATFVSRLDHLTKGRAVGSSKFGVVKCTRSAKESTDGKRRFSVSKSTVAKNRGNYDFAGLMNAFGLHR